ncbi:MAG: hypothetical protein AAF447_08515 [Myxococcota bacterium]
METVEREGQVTPELMRRALLSEQPLLPTAGVAAVLMPVFAFGLGWAGIAMALFVAGTALAIGVHQGVKAAVGAGIALRHGVGDALTTAGPGFEEALAWTDARGWYAIRGGTVIACRDGSVRALPYDDASLLDALRRALGAPVASRARRELSPSLAALAAGVALAAATILWL